MDDSLKEAVCQRVLSWTDAAMDRDALPVMMIAISEKSKQLMLFKME